MGYITPVTDRAYTDVTAKNSKAYFNVADWTRIYRNSQLASSLAEIKLSVAIAFTQLTTPTTSTIPTVASFNSFLVNIETLRLAVAAQSITGTSTAIKDDYVAGIREDAPDYIDANLWESTIDAIWNHWAGSSLLVCPVLSSNLTLLTGTQTIYVDCLDMVDYNADLQGTAKLFII